MKRFHSACAALLFACCAIFPASATVVLDAHPFAVPDPTPQIHSNGTQSGTTIFGHTLPGNVQYQFSSTSNLSTTGNGHAFIAGPWHSLTFSAVSPLNAFSSIDFNLNVGGVTRNSPFFADIIVSLVGGGTALFDNVSLRNGANQYLVYGTAGEAFSAISFTGWRNASNTISGDFIDIRQVDVNNIALVRQVPEPATWLTMILGFGLIGGWMRRRSGQHLVSSFRLS